MLGLQKHVRPLTAITVATVVALVAFVPSIAAADRSTPAPSAAAKKKKKKKEKPLTATVNASFTIRYDKTGGFGRDDGPRWAQLKVVIKDAKIPFRAPNRWSASASAKVSFTYEAERHTVSWSGTQPPGCDRADYKAWGVWSGKTRVNIGRVYVMRENGKTKKYGGWQVYALLPETGIYTAIQSSYEEWEQTPEPADKWRCLTVDDSPPSGFRWPEDVHAYRTDALGKLSSDGRSVRLNEISTEKNETGIVSGSIKFNTPAER